MDKKGGLGLFLCGIALVLHYHYARQTNFISQKENRAVEVKSAEKKNIPALKNVSSSKKEKIFFLEEGRYKFTFSNFGGGLKEVGIQIRGIIDSPFPRNQISFPPIFSLINRKTQEVLTCELWKKTETEIVFLSKLDGNLLLKQRYFLEKQKEKADVPLLRVELILENISSRAMDLSKYEISLGAAAPLNRNEFDRDSGFFFQSSKGFTFHPASSLKGGFFRKERANLNVQQKEVRYFGLMSQYFSSILIPPSSQSLNARVMLAEIFSEEKASKNSGVVATMRFPSQVLGAGMQDKLEYQFFVGEKKRKILSDLGCSEAMNYGWFSFVSIPLNQLLNFLYGMFQIFTDASWNWGLALILLTIIIRLFLWPLHGASTRSMKKMSFIQPLLQELKEKHSQNPQKLNQEMMTLYREYGVNPAAGCLPVLFQIPIFFGFYRMLQYATELRYQNFLWISDLSQPDTVAVLPIFGGFPVNIVPLLMGITMIFQMKMTPSTGDVVQRRIMLWVMPLLFLVFCYNFASALALYWTVQNLCSIAQTKLTKVNDKNPKRDIGKKSFSQKLAEQQKGLKKANAKRVK